MRIDEGLVFDGLDLNVPDVPDYTNPFKNPNLTVDATHWDGTFSTGFTPSVDGRVAVVLDDGTDAWAYGTAATQPADTTLRALGAQTELLPATPGQVWSAAADHFITHGSASPDELRWDFVFYDAAEAVISIDDGSFFAGVNSTWEHSDYENRVAPALTAFVRARLRIYTDVAGDAIGIRMRRFYVGPTATAFDVTPEDPGYTWAGDVGDSETIRAPRITLEEALDLTPPRKRKEWVTGADADGAALLRDPLFENRIIKATVRAEGDTTDEALGDTLGLIVDRIEEAERVADEGGLPIVWTPAEGTRSLTFYVLSGDVDELPIGQGSGYFAKAPQMAVTLECKPFGYGEEVIGPSASSSTPLVELEIPDVTGDVAAEGRLIVTDAASKHRQYLEWGLDQDDTALLVDSDSLVTSGFAGVGTTRTGAYDPNASGSSVIRATLASTAVGVCGLATQGHAGSLRVKARVYASGSDVRVRLRWRDADGPLQASPWVAPILGAEFVEVDLGVIDVEGSWGGQIEGYSQTPGDTLDVDYLVLIPTGNGYGKARALALADVPTAFTARDEFNQTAGALTGKTAPVGGNWAGAGDADDFTIDATADTAERNATSDADLQTGRYALSGVSAFAAQAVQVDVAWFGQAVLSDIMSGALARYVDTSNWLQAVIQGNATVATDKDLVVRKRVGGTVTELHRSVVSSVLDEADWSTIRIEVVASGQWAAWFGPQGSPAALIATGSDADLTTGGALEDGKPGLYDATPNVFALVRSYDNFAVWESLTNAVVFAGRSAEVRHDGAVRENAAGTSEGRISPYRGSYFFVPPAGRANRTSRVAVKAHRNDIEAFPSADVTDSLDVEVRYTPRYVVVPR